MNWGINFFALTSFSGRVGSKVLDDHLIDPANLVQFFF